VALDVDDGKWLAHGWQLANGGAGGGALNLSRKHFNLSWTWNSMLSDSMNITLH